MDNTGGFTEIEKGGIFKRLRSFFAEMRNSKKKYTFSRFSYIIAGLSKKDNEYQDARNAVVLCDEAISVISQRISAEDQLKTVNRKLEELSHYENVTDEDAKYLKELLAQMKSITRDRGEIKNQITSFDPALVRLSELEDDAQAIVPEIKDAERRQRMFRQDMNYLRGEKSDLEYERETLLKNSAFVHKFILIVTVIFVSCVVVMGLSAVSMQLSVAVPLTVMSILAMVITALLFTFKRRFKYELDLNAKKQQKAVGMLNKKSAVFAHYTNFLDFTYGKYKVRNAEMLKKHLKEYEHYKYLTRRFDVLRKLADETEKEIKRVLYELKIPSMSMTVEEFSRAFNLDERLDMYKAASSSKVTLEQTLKLLDGRQEKLWDALVSIERTEGGYVDCVINKYIEEAGKIVLNPMYQAGELLSSGSADFVPDTEQDDAPFGDLFELMDNKPKEKKQ